MGSDIAKAVAEMLVDTSWRLLAIVLLVEGVLASGRVRASVLRHRAWTVALIGILCLPLLGRIVPPVRVQIPTNLIDPGAAAGPAEFAAVDERVAPTLASSPDMDAASVSMPNGQAGATAGDRVDGRALQLTWHVPVVVLYAAGLAWALGSFAVGWIRTTRMARAARAVAGIQDPRVFESTAIVTPVTVGVRPRILLPVTWRSWPEDTLRAVLAHEQAHVVRRDTAVAFAAHALRSVFWFHPAAWWIERRLAAEAEHVCDEAAVRAAGTARGYATTLLEFAAIVRAHHGRLAWHGVGVDRPGLLERRIHRVLVGGTARRPSGAVTAAVVSACAAALALVVSCQRRVEPPPLRENPQEAARIAQQKANAAFHKTAGEMTADQVTSLESTLGRGQDDLAAMKTLRSFYEQSGAQTLGWNTMIARRQRHIVWLIANHPEHPLAMWRVSRAADPGGYDAVSRAWAAQTDNPGASVLTLENAGWFFAGQDEPRAEQLLLRARAAAPGGLPLDTDAPEFGTASWSSELGRFYGKVLAGQRDPKNGRPTTALGQDAFAQDVGRRLLASDEAQLLAAAGSGLGMGMADPERRTLAKQLLERALELDGRHPYARVVLASIEAQDRRQIRRDRLRARQAELAGGDLPQKLAGGVALSRDEGRTLRQYEYDAVSVLPESDRLGAYADLAEDAYVRAEHLQFTEQDEAGAQASWVRSTRAAEAALALAGRLSGQPEADDVVYRATVALALHELRAGRRSEAVALMGKAGDARVPAQPVAWSMPGLGSRLVNELLKAGERGSVARFLEQSAPRAPVARDQILRDAASIRAGEMPLSYQHMLAR